MPGDRRGTWCYTREGLLPRYVAVFLRTLQTTVRLPKSFLSPGLEAPAQESSHCIAGYYLPARYICISSYLGRRLLDVRGCLGFTLNRILGVQPYVASRLHLEAFEVLFDMMSWSIPFWEAIARLDRLYSKLAVSSRLARALRIGLTLCSSLPCSLFDGRGLGPTTWEVVRGELGRPEYRAQRFGARSNIARR